MKIRTIWKIVARSACYHTFSYKSPCKASQCIAIDIPKKLQLQLSNFSLWTSFWSVQGSRCYSMLPLCQLDKTFDSAELNALLRAVVEKTDWKYVRVVKEANTGYSTDLTRSASSSQPVSRWCPAKWTGEMDSVMMTNAHSFKEFSWNNRDVAGAQLAK